MRHQEREEQVAARERGESYEPKLKSGMALDTCICVHAEANALLAAARFGISVDGATLYTTLNPCFTCLKESMQAGIKRIVYLEKYPATYLPVVADQYVQLVGHLRRGGDQQNEPTMFLFEPFNGKEMIDVNEPGQEPDIGRVDQPGDGSGHR